MTSITSMSSSAHASPLDRLKAQLSTEVSSGTIASGDQSALSNALDTIDSALSSQRSSGAGRPQPGELEDKINSLIGDQVDSGALTSDQADELKQLFSDTFKQGPGGGQPPGPPPTDAASGGSAQDTSDISSLMDDFLKKLQETVNSQNGYSADGQSAGGSSVSLLLDYTA